MPPKTNESKNVSIIAEEENIYISEVEKTFFEIQFENIYKKIDRLKEDSKLLIKNTNILKRKTAKLNEKFAIEFKVAQNILEEKEILEKKLREEIYRLKNESKSLVENHENQLNEMYNEFINETRKIKSRMSVYAGRLNKLEEYFKQENLLEQKLVDLKEEIRAMDENFEIKMNNIEEKKYQMKTAVKNGFVGRCVDFAERTHLDENPAVVKCFLELNIVMDMLKTSEELRAESEREYRDAREVVKRNNSSEKSSIKKFNEVLKIKLENEHKLEDLKRELAEEQALLDDSRRELQECQNAVNEAATGAQFDRKAAVEATLQEAETIRMELQRIQSTDEAVDLHILLVEDVLLRIYEEAKVHAENIKTDGVIGMENMKEFIKKLNEIKPLTVPEEFTVDHLDKIVQLTENENSNAT